MDKRGQETACRARKRLGCSYTAAGLARTAVQAIVLWTRENSLLGKPDEPEEPDAAESTRSWLSGCWPTARAHENNRPNNRNPRDTQGANPRSGDSAVAAQIGTTVPRLGTLGDTPKRRGQLVVEPSEPAESRAQLGTAAPHKGVNRNWKRKADHTKKGLMARPLSFWHPYSVRSAPWQSDTQRKWTSALLRLYTPRLPEPKRPNNRSSIHLATAYHAKLRLRHTLLINPSVSYNPSFSSIENRAMHISVIAFQALFNDVKKLVADGVRRDITAIISAAPDQDSVDRAVARGRERESFLKHWLTIQRPLAFGQVNKQNTFISLLQAVIADTDLISHGLPNFSEHAITPTTFVNSLIAMSSPTNPSPPVAPVMSSGSFLPLLKEAHSLLLSLPHLSPSGDQHDLIRRSFITTISHLLIRFVPSHRPRSSSSGTSPCVPVFDSWASLGLQDDARTIIPLQHPSISLPNPSQLAAQSALNTALVNDAAAEWSLEGITIPLIHTILNKSSLPIDFITPLPASAPYINDTYHWVRHNYDPRKTIHCLALVVAIIVSHFLPCVFPPHPIPSDPFTSASDPFAIYQAYCTLPWESCQGKKGVSDCPIYISMVTTFIIAIYERNSPLGRRLFETKSLGSPWAAKHTVKGISYINLIRLGIIWGS
ncbi:hypothetical protein EDB86DRAFT_2828490 [Lactarius hatsudake]|nr:hypothetical protein EDB86DRAFT_2828490 [Lactarius hatsudake]